MLKNILIVWLKRYVKSHVLEWIHREKHLSIGYMVSIRNCSFGSFNTIYNNATLNDVSMGDMTYVGVGANLAKCTIGSYCSIGPGVFVGLGKHPSKEFVSTHPAFFSLSKQSQVTFVDRQKYIESVPVKIGSDVWIGAGAIVLDGVTIGDGAIIGAGAIVVRDVAPFGIALGTPARVERYRFSSDEIDYLLDLQWWNKGPEWVKEHSADFESLSKLILSNKGE